MIIPHIRKSENNEQRLSEEVRIAMRNVPYVPTDSMSGVTYRTVKRIFFYGFMIFMFSASVVVYYGEALMSPRAQDVFQQIAAGIFLLMVLVNFVIEIGWNERKR